MPNRNERITPQSQPLHTTTKTPFIDIAGLSEAGTSRSKNEDSFLTADLKRELVLGPSSLPLQNGACLIDNIQGKIMAVADGVSKHGAGALASSVVLGTLARYIGTIMPWIVEAGEDDEQMLADEFERAFRRCQKRLRQEAARHGGPCRDLATTLTVAYIEWPHLCIAHAGDSRCYLYRAQRLRRLTSDDTMGQRMLDHQVASEDEVPVVPFANILVNAVGGDRDDLSVEFHRIPLLGGDRILLCTDGLTQHLSHGEIRQTLQSGVTAETCCRRLLDLATAKGGGDNMTAVVACIH